MDMVCNFPAVSILLCLFGGIISSGLKQVAARIINAVLILTVIVLSATTFVYTLATGSSFVYVMGRFPAPWGNEIRAGMLETFMATFFGIIMLLSLLGGEKKLHDEVEEDKIFLYYVLNDLLLSSLLALVYTNDLFTAYVFIEINTIAACGLIMIRQNGRTIEAAVRYMIMSLLGSGMILLSICLLYDITGHLLMSNIKETIVSISHYDTYYIPLTVAIALICVGLAIKSALYQYPVHIRSGGNDLRFSVSYEGRRYQTYDRFFIGCADRIYLHGLRFGNSGRHDSQHFPYTDSCCNKIAALYFCYRSYGSFRRQQAF